MSKTTLVFATNNLNKLMEVQAMLPNYNIKSLAAIHCFEEILETAKTLQGNALLKAQYVFEKYAVNCFADDTGLEVEALNNEPGVYSARYSGEQNNSEENIKKLLKNLENQTNRKAQFRTVIALIFNNQTYYFEGICKGEILINKKGSGGFGYDAVFMPKGFAKSFAEMTMEEKGEISHRGLAIKKLVAFLKQNFE